MKNAIDTKFWWYASAGMMVLFVVMFLAGYVQASQHIEYSAPTWLTALSGSFWYLLLAIVCMMAGVVVSKKRNF